MGRASTGCGRGRTVLTALILLALAGAGAAEDVAVTTADPRVPLDELELMLLPLDKGELEVEAAAWIALVKAKLHELSDAEIAARYKRIEITKAEEAAAAARAAREAAEEAAEARQELRAGDDVEREEVEEAIEEAEQAAVEAQEALQAAAEVEQRAEENEGAQEVIEAAVAEAAEENADVSEEAELDAGVIVEAEEADAEVLEEVATAAAEAADAKTEVREAIFERVNELRNERTELLERAGLVLDELEEKGGEVDEERKYLEAVSGVQIDVTDTTAVWSTVVGWLKAPEGGVRWLKNFGRFLAVLVVAWVLAHLLSRLVEHAMKLSDKVSELTRLFVLRTLRRVIIALGFIAALATLEINVGPLLAIVGAASFILAFALQDSLGNLASGIMIMVFRPFDVGDLIHAAGARGRVHSMNIVSTTIKTPDNQIVIVPNRKIWGDVITNVTGSERRRVDMIFHVGHDADVDRAQAIIERVLSENPRVLHEPEPLVCVHDMETSGVSLLCRPWVKTAERRSARSEITRAVKAEFDRASIPPPAAVRIHRVENLPASADTGERAATVRP